MSAPLQLQFTCSAAEKQEAQSLGLRQQLGRGSKWVTLSVLGLVLIVALSLFCFMIRYEVSPAYRPYVLVGTVAVFIFFFFRNRRALRRSTRGPECNIEVSDTGLTMISGSAKVSSPWSAFSACLESPNLFVLVDRAKTVLLIFPKRVFPDETAQNWFRSLSVKREGVPETVRPPDPMVAASSDKIVLRFRLGFRDYLDRTLASARTWVSALCLVAFLLGLTIYTGAHPPPHPVYSITQFYFLFVVPASVVAAVMLVFIFTLNAWLSQKSLLIPQETILSKESIGFVSTDGTSVLPWTNYVCHKETRRSFIAWNPKSRAWMLLPKRAFASNDELRRCRDLLASNLRASRCFFG